MIDITWVNRGDNPELIDWDSPVESAPITAATVYLEKFSFDGRNIEAHVAYGASSFGLGVRVNFFQQLSGVPSILDFEVAEGNIVKFTLANTVTSNIFYVNVQAATPTVNGQGQASFEAPFSLGPESVLVQLPLVPMMINSADYDGYNLNLSWMLRTDSGVVVTPDESIIEILNDRSVLTTQKGGATAANMLLDVQGQANIKANIYTSVDQFSSIPLSVHLITDTPKVTNVSFDANAGSVTANVDAMGSSLQVQAYLMDGEVQLAEASPQAPGQVSFDFDATNRVGLSIIARSISSDGKIIGPPSPPAYLLATAPTIHAAQIRTDSSDPTKWQIDCQWERLPDEASTVKEYTLDVKQEAVVIASVSASTTSATISVAKSDLDLTKVQSLVLSATNSSNGSSPITMLPLFFNSPQLTSIVTTDDQIKATWEAPANVSALDRALVSYNLVLALEDGTNLYTGPATDGLQGAAPLTAFSLDRNEAPLLMVNITVGPITLFADNSMGNRNSASPLLVAPAFQPITVNPLNNNATLSWSGPDNADSYTIRYTSGNPTTGVTGDSYTLDTALDPAAQFGYTVEAVGTSNSVSVTGPASPLVYLPTNVGNVQTVRFNSTTAEVSWAPIPEAISYTVFIYANDNPNTPAYTESTPTTSLSFAFTADTSKQYTVYVQGQQPEGAGLCGTTQGLFTPGLFISQQPATAVAPYLYPTATMADLGTDSSNPNARTLTLYLPELGTSSALGGQTITEQPFKIESTESGSPLPYKLTIFDDDPNKPSVWSWSTSEIRNDVQMAYINFLENVESPGGGAPGATPYGISILQSAIGRYLPQTFAELLYYNFGFTTNTSYGAASVDLRPGMVLRVVISNYNYLNNLNPPSYVEGYAGATTFDFEIGGYTAGGNWRLGFNNFLSQLSASGVLTVNTPMPGTPTGVAYPLEGAAGAVDLYFPSFIQPFYRLFVPTNVADPTLIGSNSTTDNFTLAAAPTYADLQMVSNTTNSATAYFRGRSTLEVMIKIQLNGSQQLVPVGTTLGNLLDQMGMRPFAASKVLDQLRLYRAMGPVVTDLPLSNALDAVQEVRFDWNGFTTYANGNGLDALSMPLLPGDQVFTQKN